MAKPIKTPLPPDLDLPDGYTVTWAAIDPTDGSDVSGVVVSDVSIFGTALGAGSGQGFAAGPYMLVPGQNA